VLQVAMEEHPVCFDQFEEESVLLALMGSAVRCCYLVNRNISGFLRHCSGQSSVVFHCDVEQPNANCKLLCFSQRQRRYAGRAGIVFSCVCTTVCIHVRARITAKKLR